MDLKDNVVVLKTAFLIGAVADAVLALEWFLISLGLEDREACFKIWCLNVSN